MRQQVVISCFPFPFYTKTLHKKHSYPQSLRATPTGSIAVVPIEIFVMTKICLFYIQFGIISSAKYLQVLERNHNCMLILCQKYTVQSFKQITTLSLNGPRRPLSITETNKLTLFKLVVGIFCDPNFMFLNNMSDVYKIVCTRSS